MSRPTLYRPQDNTADAWRAMARDERNSRARSFANSDTDGFLSQAAGQAMAHELPAVCHWFAKCPNPANGLRDHPVLGDVPICQRCDDKIEAMR